MSKSHAFPILSIIGLGGIIVSSIFGTVKSMKDIAQAEKERRSKLTKTEIVKLCYKNYILTLAFTATTITCIAINEKINNDILNNTNNLLHKTENELSLFKSTAEGCLGKGMIDIYDQHSKSKMHSEVITGKEVSIDNGSYLIFESESKKYFRSTIEDVKRCINLANSEMNTYKDYISYTELLSMYGLNKTDISDYVGWNKERDKLILPIFTYDLAENGEPCCIISYINSPHSDYQFYSGW